MKKKDIGIVVPTFNESENIEIVLEKLSTVAQNSDYTFGVLVVDDSSPDGTAQIVQKCIDTKRFPKLNLELMVRTGKQGLATAYTQGFSRIAPHTRWVVSMDADLSHNPEYLPHMVKKAESEVADLVVGSRYVYSGGVQGWGPVRLFVSRVGSLFAQLVLMSPIRDQTGGYNLYKSDLISQLSLETIKTRGYLFQIQMKYRTTSLRKRVVEYPIIFVDRVHGKSKFSRDIIIEAFFGVILLRLGLQK